MLARALDEDLRKLAETRGEIDDVVQVHASTLADRRNDISELLAADVGKIEDAFRRQTGVIEERTGTMERALSAGVDNVRQVLEKSAVVVAGALRDKVLEVTAALNQEAGNAFTDADRQIAERAEKTSSALLARADEIASAFDEADERAGRAARTPTCNEPSLLVPTRLPTQLAARAEEDCRPASPTRAERNRPHLRRRRPAAWWPARGDRAVAGHARRRHPAQLRRCRPAPGIAHRRIRRGARRPRGRTCRASSTPPTQSSSPASPRATPRSAPAPAKSSASSSRPTSACRHASADSADAIGTGRANRSCQHVRGSRQAARRRASSETADTSGRTRRRDRSTCSPAADRRARGACSTTVDRQIAARVGESAEALSARADRASPTSFDDRRAEDRLAHWRSSQASSTRPSSGSSPAPTRPRPNCERAQAIEETLAPPTSA